MKNSYACDRCGLKVTDKFDAFWFGDNHYCQDCYFVATRTPATPGPSDKASEGEGGRE